MRRQFEYIISEDPIYNTYLVNNFINRFVKSGKKEQIEKVIYSVLNKYNFFIFFELVCHNSPLYDNTIRFYRFNRVKITPLLILEGSRSTRKGLSLFSKNIKRRLLSTTPIHTLRRQLKLELRNFEFHKKLGNFTYKDDHIKISTKILKENRKFINFERMLLKSRLKVYKTY